ncbi:MAG: CPBP family intramembrane metalloprotease [Myxococcota bacterium]|nr:CPBP family intramembrane metalloprotease [Myxococcota bacterium]
MTPERRAVLSTWPVIRVLLATSARRWMNRLSGQFRNPFRRGKPAVTPGKHRPVRLAALPILALFVVLGMSVASGVIGNLARTISDAPDRRISIDKWTYRAIVRAAERIADAESSGRDPARVADIRRTQRAKVASRLAVDTLEDRVPRDADPLPLLAPDQRARVDSMLEQFDARGADAFRSIDDDGFLDELTWLATSAQFRTVIALLLGLSYLCLLLMSLGNANTDLGHVDWTMQWLFTLPISARALFLAKTIEYALLNAVSWIFHFSLLVVVLWTVGYRWWAVPLAIGATLYSNVIIAVSRLLLETWLRKRMALPRLKNIQAVCTALGTLSMLALYMCSSRTLPFELSALAVIPEHAVRWLPWSLPVTLVAGGPAAVGAGAAMLVGGVALTAAGVRLGEHLVRDGLIVGAGAYRGERGAAPAASRRWFRGIVDRELVLLLRDRNLLLQTLILPILVIAFQIGLNPAVFAGATHDARHASALAFGIGAFVLMGGGFMALSNEGKALWLLFTFPQRIDQVLLRKATVWGSAAALYTLGIIVAVAVLSGGLDLEAVIGSVMALVGIAIFAVIAVGMGILATNPLAEEVQRKVRPTVMWTYMALAALYGYGFYAPHWNKLVLGILCALLAFAIWQTVRDRAPLLLDPIHQPTPQLALSDGLIAVLGFFVFQSAIAVAGRRAGAPPEQMTLIAFVAAGVLVTLIALYVVWRRQVPNILSTLGIRGSPQARSQLASVLLGVVLGAGAGSLGRLYQSLVLDAERTTAVPTALAVLAVIAAPLCEELIFRGLVFRGLRRSSHLAVAMIASAALFAIVHPPASFVPVFGLGLVTAFSYERTHRLIAPVCAHAVYNAMVLFMWPGL